MDALMTEPEHVAWLIQIINKKKKMLPLPF